MSSGWGGGLKDLRVLGDVNQFLGAGFQFLTGVGGSVVVVGGVAGGHPSHLQGNVLWRDRENPITAQGPGNDARSCPPLHDRPWLLAKAVPGHGPPHASRTVADAPVLRSPLLSPCL